MTPQHPSPRPAAADHLQVAPLDSEAQAALDTLADTFMEPDVVAATIISTMDVPLDLAIAHFKHTHELARRTTELARLLVHYTIGSPRAPRPAGLRAAREAVAEETSRFWDGIDPEELPPHLETELRNAALTEIGDLVREVGLEELDADIHIGFQKDAGDAPVLAWVPVPPATAHIWLLSRLYPRVELALQPDPLLRLERLASRWWFERWSSAAHRSEEWEFTWTVREQEYSLVERITVAMEAPILTGYRLQPFFAELPARQQRIAQALDESFIGIFTVREHEGSRLILEDAADGQRYEVHEHNPTLAYQAGFLALGRLLPFEDDLFLRSPGMAFLQSTGPELAANLAQGLDMAEDGPGPGIAIETFLALIQHRTQVPRRVIPADSPREAKDLLDAFRKAMEERDLLETFTEEEAPEEIREQIAEQADRKDLQFFRMPVDEPLAEWMNALTEQARAAERKSRKAKQKKGKPKGKKRKH